MGFARDGDISGLQSSDAAPAATKTRSAATYGNTRPVGALGNSPTIAGHDRGVAKNPT